MNSILKYYNYAQCYAHYTDRVMSIRQAKIRGEVIVAKPVQSKEWRTRLRDYIVKHKLTDGNWLCHLSEGLASLAAILMVA